MKYTHITTVMQPTVDRLRGRHCIVGKKPETDKKGNLKFTER